MRKPIALLALAALTLALGVGLGGSAAAGDPPARKAATKTVTLGDNFFSPKRLTVKKGTILRFVWGRGHEGTFVEHDVTGVKGNKFSSGEPELRPEKPFRKRITRTTSIVCTVHATTMKMTVKVKKPRRKR